jgi:DNA-nicking Smr family endonuclease
MPRRRRGLSPEDRRLWDELARTTKPLHPAQPEATPAAGPLPRADPPAPVTRPPRPAPAATPRIAYAPPATLERASPHMDRRRFDKLRRGRLEPEARIDLHGMTAERAHTALTGFILRAHDDGLRLVLVITGKGRPDDGATAPRRHGILRHSLPHWLAAPPLNARVLQVAGAHQRHGGAGAFYVYLRRRR